MSDFVNAGALQSQINAERVVAKDGADGMLTRLQVVVMSALALIGHMYAHTLNRESVGGHALNGAYIWGM